jgi:hypothetical protein
MSRRRYPANLRAVLATLRDAGFRPTVRRNKYFHVTWLDGDGRLYIVIVSNTPSGWSASRMALADVRRAMRQTEINSQI